MQTVKTSTFSLIKFTCKFLKSKEFCCIMFSYVSKALNLQKYTFANLRLILFNPHFQIFGPCHKRFQQAYCRLPQPVSASAFLFAMPCVLHKSCPAGAAVASQTSLPWPLPPQCPPPVAGGYWCAHLQPQRKVPVRQYHSGMFPSSLCPASIQQRHIQHHNVDAFSLVIIRHCCNIST